MTMKTIRLSLLAVAVAVGAISARPAAAQRWNRGPRVGQRAPADPAAAEAKRQRVRQRIAALRAWKLTDALGLDQATSGRLFPILDQYDEKFLVVLRAGADLRRTIRAELASPTPDPAKLDRAIDGLVANQGQAWRLQQERFAAVRKVLRPDQAAKALVLLPAIDRAIGKKIRKAMRHGPMQPGPMQPGPMQPGPMQPH